MKQLLAVVLILVTSGAMAQAKKYPIQKTESEWKKQLTALQFEVTRKKGTEAAYTGKYWNSHKKGMYNCICCSVPLFSSTHKFYSGTGWPSFWQPLVKANVEEMADNTYGMQRTEVNCSNCGAHLGHVFNDGPNPTGLRYCINAASLKFTSQKK